MPESDDVREGPRRDVLAARRARRAGLGDPTPLQRAESAEAMVRTLESNLADLRRRLLETEHERERLAQQVAEREHELRRVKQREYAEQQLRVEAEEHFTRLRRGHHAELDRLRERLGEARAAAQLAQERGVRAEHERDELVAHLARVGQSCERLQAGIAALADVAAELRGTFERERALARRRISALERALARAQQVAGTESTVAAPAAGEAATSSPEEDARRAEMAAALAAAVGRLRARATEPSLARPTPAAEQASVAPPTPVEPPAPVVAPRSSRPPTAAGPPEPTVPPAPAAQTTSAESPRPVEPSTPAKPRTPSVLETPAAAGAQPVSRVPLGVRSEEEIPTVVVVPRLFAGARRPRPRLAVLGGRLGTALIRWSERSRRA